MDRASLKNPVYETKIHRAVFINQNIIVYPKESTLPENIKEVIEFLFGEGACLQQYIVNNRCYIAIKGAAFALREARTLNADLTFKEIKERD